MLVPLQRFSNEHGKPSGPLMRVHWLRLVLDEGHSLGAQMCISSCRLARNASSVSLRPRRGFDGAPDGFLPPGSFGLFSRARLRAGASLSITSKLQVACAIAAERRWVVTGTPTPAALRGQLSHLRPLLAFLKEGTFGSHEKKWAVSVQRPLEGSQRAPGSGAGGAAGGAAGGGGGTPASEGGGGGKTLSRTGSGASRDTEEGAAADAAAGMAAAEEPVVGDGATPTDATPMQEEPKPEPQPQEDGAAPADAADGNGNGNGNGSGNGSAGGGSTSQLDLEWDGARERAAAARRLHDLLRRLMARTRKARAGNMPPHDASSASAVPCNLSVSPAVSISLSGCRVTSYHRMKPVQFRRRISVSRMLSARRCSCRSTGTTPSCTTIWCVDGTQFPFISSTRVRNRLRFVSDGVASFPRLAPAQVAHVRRALLLADWCDPSHEQSLQNPKNARLARTAVDNLREACNVAGRRA